ncbi:arginine--tRNA ligase [Pseudoalteromonas maricaloris]|uniref:arginine--tRNA ligase n=1 Tax=Pseudoalteromonas maricaloris TaxID=184924 RepID=UPI003C1C4061
MQNRVFKEISEVILSLIENRYEINSLNISDIYGALTEPPTPDLGDFAFPCFSLSKVLRKSPINIAEEMSALLNKGNINYKAENFGPYINFTFTPSYLFNEVVEEVNSKRFFTKKLTDKQSKIMVEYSQPNTHKELHVGHMRNLCLGNAIVKIKKYCDQNVVATTYPGDVGTHVAKCLWFMKYHNTETLPDSRKEKAEFLGKLYTKGNLKLEEERGTNKESANREALTNILMQLKNKKGEFYDLWLETREWSIELMKEVYSWSDVEFDHWFFESEVDAPSIAYVNKLYEQGVLVKSDGAIGMDLNEDNLGFCMLIKSDGTGLYATKDVELAKCKFEDFNIDENIYIVDNRQSLHFKQVFKVLENVGFKQAKDCYHLQYEMVELPDGAMSSRKGNIIPVQSLIEEMERKIVSDYLSRYEGEWSAEKIGETAKIISNGAIKYGMLRVDNNRKIVFDLDEWLNLDGETGPYIQYTVARAKSILDKYSTNELNNYKVLETKSEKALMVKISRFNDVVLACHEKNKTFMLTGYLYELAKLFNSFYANNKIGSLSDEAIKQSRLKLVNAVYYTLEYGLGLLGIKCPDRM